MLLVVTQKLISIRGLPLINRVHHRKVEYFLVNVCNFEMENGKYEQILTLKAYDIVGVC